MHAGKYVDSIQVKYGDVWGPNHGSDGGDVFEALLPEAEQIWSVVGAVPLPLFFQFLLLTDIFDSEPFFRPS